MVTLQRLELCGGLLAANLTRKARTPLSMILARLRVEPRNLKTFVGNGLSQIQKVTAISHVSTNDKPADLLSRVVSITDFKNLQSWFNKPRWLVGTRSYRVACLHNDTH